VKACYNSVQNLAFPIHIYIKEKYTMKYNSAHSFILTLKVDLTFREEHRLTVFNNIAQRKVFGLKREELAGGSRRLHNKELNDLFSSPNIIQVIKSRTMRWAVHVARMGERCLQGFGGET
jgi:hypothetical protein